MHWLHAPTFCAMSIIMLAVSFDRSTTPTNFPASSTTGNVCTSMASICIKAWRLSVLFLIALSCNDTRQCQDRVEFVAVEVAGKFVRLPPVLTGQQRGELPRVDHSRESSV